MNKAFKALYDDIYVYSRLLRLRKIRKRNIRDIHLPWLEKIYYKEFISFKRLYTELPPERWIHYELVGNQDLDEYIKLQHRIRVLRIAWEITMPDILRFKQ